MFFFHRETDSEIMCCRFNPEGNLIAVGLVNGVTKVRNFVVLYILFYDFIIAAIIDAECFLH